MKYNNIDFEQLKNSTDCASARVAMQDVIRKTPLIHSEKLSETYGNEIYLKPECLQKTGSFKIRGAYNKMRKLSEEEKSRGVICASAGNHAQGVAFSAKKLGIKATIVMPETSPLIKVNATKSYGVEVVLSGEVYDEAYETAKKLEKEYGYTFIHPFNDVDVIEGQGTIANEILEDLPDADCIVF